MFVDSIPITELELLCRISPWFNKLNATAKAAAFHGFNASTRSDPASTQGWSKFVGRTESGWFC
jgi:hypothetical protein